LEEYFFIHKNEKTSKEKVSIYKKFIIRIKDRYNKKSLKQKKGCGRLLTMEEIMALPLNEARLTLEGDCLK